MELQQGFGLEWQKHCDSWMFLSQGIYLFWTQVNIQSLGKYFWLVFFFLICIGPSLFLFLFLFKILTKLFDASVKFVVYTCVLFCVYHLYCS